MVLMLVEGRGVIFRRGIFSGWLGVLNIRG